MPQGLLLELAGLGVLFLLSGFFSASETALFSLSRARVQRLGETGGVTGRAIANLLCLPRRLLITILVGNMLVNTAAASIIAARLTRNLGGQGVALAIAATTLLLLLFGEVTPKTLAVRHAEAVARAAALPLLWFSRLIFPIRCVLRYITNALLGLLRRGHIESENLLTRREFTAALEAGEEAGAIDEHEADMVEHIFEFPTIAARELMVPRTEMACVSEEATIKEALDLAQRTHRSRLPVYGQSVDDIWGIFDIREFPAWRGKNIWGQSVREFVAARDAMPDPPRRPLVRPALFVPESRHVGDLLRDMREGGTHMVILLDEYGGTAGLVTLRDLADELVGGVLSREPDTRQLCRRGDGCLQVLGEARVRDLNSDLGFDLPLDRADTIGGYVLDLIGELPKPGATASDECFLYRVLRLAGRRIGAVEVRPHDPAGEAWQRIWAASRRATEPEAPPA
ncbi:MAG TPA: hemolysin family protein [Planctomycetota bacterium]|nr:hemolysin family protein [Planctomycetota bacterium]